MKSKVSTNLKCLCVFFLIFVSIMFVICFNVAENIWQWLQYIKISFIHKICTDSIVMWVMNVIIIDLRVFFYVKKYYRPKMFATSNSALIHNISNKICFQNQWHHFYPSGDLSFTALWALIYRGLPEILAISWYVNT